MILRGNGRLIKTIILFLLFILPSTLSGGCDYYPRYGEAELDGGADTGGEDQLPLEDEEKEGTAPPADLLEDISIELSSAKTIPGNHLIVKIGPFWDFPPLELKTNLIHEFTTRFFEGGYVYILLGINYANQPGNYELNFVISEEGKEEQRITEKLILEDGNFDFSRFSVPPTVIDGWTAEQLAKDRETVRLARERTEKVHLWSGPFIWPVAGRISSDFGAVRVINNAAPSRHSGIDIALPEGTPFVAANRGVVTLAEFLLASGNAVFIDHGLGLSSAYLHMHEIFVEEGELVEQGDVIGTVGTTGFSSGPHLHWSIYIGYTPVSPYPFMDGLLPYLPM